MDALKSYVFLLFFMGFAISTIAQQPPGMIANDCISETLSIAEDFLNGLENNEPGISLKKLFQIFPIDADQQGSFGNKIASLLARLGPPTGYELIGVKAIGRCERYFLIYFISYHSKMPVAWEFTFYRPFEKKPWQLNFLRFDSDDIFDFFNYSGLQVEVNRNLSTLKSFKDIPEPLNATSSPK